MSDEKNNKETKLCPDILTQEIRNIIKTHIAEPYKCTRSGTCPDIHGCRFSAFNTALILSDKINNKTYKHNEKRRKIIEEHIGDVLNWGKCQETEYIKDINGDALDEFIRTDNIYIIITNFEWLYGINSPYHTFVINTKSDGNDDIWQSWYDGNNNYVRLNKTEIHTHDLLRCLKEVSGNKDCIQTFFTAPPNHIFKNVSSAYIIDFTRLYNHLCQSVTGGKKKSRRRKKRSKRRRRSKQRRRSNNQGK